MLLWAGFALLIAGMAAFAIDRRAAQYFHAKVDWRFERILHRTTDWAKGALWLTIASLAFVASRVIAWCWGPSPITVLLGETSLAFLASLAVASVILHAIKILLGRRRPRDELELDLYGFRPFTFDLASDSFPSGHALTIFCVAVVLSAAAPMLTPLWFIAAALLALTRALLNSHFVSDVLVGAAIGLIATREVLLDFFPVFARGWF
jgi:membrane-associated phospholipid phosphatase